MADVLLLKLHNAQQLDIVSYPLGLMYLSAVARQKGGHRIRLVDMRVEEGSLEQCLDRERFSPDLIGISALSDEASLLAEAATTLKAHFNGTPIVVGGPHATAYPDEVLALATVDFIVQGEGEETFSRLLDALDSRAFGSIPGLGFKLDGRPVINEQAPPVARLDELPYPDWASVPVDRYATRQSMCPLERRRFMSLFTSRGCPYRCIYCHGIFGKRWRARSPENVVAEMKALVERHGIREFEIVDDAFNLDRQRVLAICELIGRERLDVGLAFPNGLRTDVLDEEVIRALRRAGTRFFGVAVETASPRLQKLIKKNLDLAAVGRAVALANSLGILTTGFFMLGFPTETREEMMATIRLATRMKLHFAFFFIVTPFRGTELAEIYDTRRVSDSEGYCSSVDFLHTSFSLSTLDGTELKKMQQKAFRRFYMNPWRIYRILKDAPPGVVPLNRLLRGFRRIFTLTETREG